MGSRANNHSYETKLKIVKLVREDKGITASSVLDKVDLVSKATASVWVKVIKERIAKGMTNEEILATGFYEARYKPKNPTYKQVPLFTTPKIPKADPVIVAQISSPQPPSHKQEVAKKKNIVLVCSDDPQAILDVLKGML